MKQFDQEARNARAVNVEIKETLDEGLFTVRGETSLYVVDLHAKTCNCPDYVYRCAKEGGVCKHYVKVRDFVAKMKEVIA